MSFLSGCLSGTLVAAGMYYAVFSRDLQIRTVTHQKGLRSLVYNLEAPHIHAPPSAAARIQHDSRTTLLKQCWNEEIEGLFHFVQSNHERVIEWGRHLVGSNRTQ